jgi:ketosteroid isomerase-like protein
MSIEHTVIVQLTTDPGQHPFAFAAAFNTGSVDAVERVYEPDGIFVREDGVAVTGAERRAANAEFLSLGLPISVIPRQVHVTGDLVLLIVDWTIDGPGMHLEGTATDVARRGADGYWRYVIDNPFGVG